MLDLTWFLLFPLVPAWTRLWPPGFARLFPVWIRLDPLDPAWSFPAFYVFYYFPLDRNHDLYYHDEVLRERRRIRHLWRNWHTRMIQVHVHITWVRVQVPPSARRTERFIHMGRSFFHVFFCYHAATSMPPPGIAALLAHAQSSIFKRDLFRFSTDGRAKTRAGDRL